jgi:hypothetical protein
MKQYCIYCQTNTKTIQLKVPTELLQNIIVEAEQYYHNVLKYYPKYYVYRVRGMMNMIDLKKIFDGSDYFLKVSK